MEVLTADPVCCASLATTAFVVRKFVVVERAPSAAAMVCATTAQWATAHVPAHDRQCAGSGTASHAVSASPGTTASSAPKPAFAPAMESATKVASAAGTARATAATTDLPVSSAMSRFYQVVKTRLLVLVQRATLATAMEPARVFQPLF